MFETFFRLSLTGLDTFRVRCTKCGTMATIAVHTTLHFPKNT
jgi:hypothetical protein